MKFPTEAEKVEELILEYSLHNDMYQVIKGFTSRKGSEYFLNLRGSTIPDRLIFSPTISAIVKNEQVQYFNKVIEMLARMQAEQPQAVRPHRFSQIMVVLKIKAFLYDVSQGVKLSKMLSKLDDYFPNTTEMVDQYQRVATGCRNLLRNLIFSQSEERVRMKEMLENQYGRKYMRKFQASVNNMLKEFKATLSVPILQQVVYECENSQTFHNLPLSSGSVLDKLIEKCLQSAPSEDTLLLFLEEIWNAKTANEQNDYIGGSQIYNFLCSSSFMESMSFEGSEMVSGVSSQRAGESNDLSMGVISSSLKIGTDVTDKCSGVVSESSHSSGSSKSISLLRKPSGVTSREGHITANTEGKYINPEIQKQHLNINTQDFSNPDITDSGKFTDLFTSQVNNDDRQTKSSSLFKTVEETSFAMVTEEMQNLFEYSSINISDEDEQSDLEEIIIDEKKVCLKSKGMEKKEKEIARQIKEKEIVKGRVIEEIEKMANFDELPSRFDPGITSTQCQDMHEGDDMVHLHEYLEVEENADSESDEMSF